MTIQRKYDPIIGDYTERLSMLRSKAESAKRAELHGEDSQGPEDETWHAAQKRFNEALAEPLNLGNGEIPVE